MPLDDVLGPIGVEVVVGEVTGFDHYRHELYCAVAGRSVALPYDRLVFALGSQLARPPIPGLAAHGFDIDTYDAAGRLAAHLAALPQRPDGPGRFTALVVGGGLTGVEAAAELATRLPAIAGGAPCRVILINRAPRVGSTMGEDACAVIEEALRTLKIEMRPGVTVASIDERGVRLSSGEAIEAATVVWCAGMRAHPPPAALPGAHDGFGRVAADRFLRVEAEDGIFAAGDVAAAFVDGTHAAVMSCQHARPMERIAGHNVVCDLVGAKMIPLDIGYYVTCLDLGAWGALYTEGRDRRVAVTGAAAKETERMISCERIYPPRSRDPAKILAAAAPVTQTPPRQSAAT